MTGKGLGRIGVRVMMMGKFQVRSGGGGEVSWVGLGKFNGEVLYE